MTEYLPNGFGGSTGSELAIARNIYAHLPGAGDGRIVYCSSVTGANAAWPRGSSENYPVATLAQAITNADEGGIIILASDHDETLASAATPLAYQYILGLGRSQGLPTAKLRLATGSHVLLDVSVDGVVLDNVYLPEKTATSTARSRIAVAADFFRLQNCYGTSGDYDVATAIVEYLAGSDNGSVIENCSFLSTATAKTTAPAPAIIDTGSDAHFWINGLTLDGGEYGWGYGVAPTDVPCAFYRNQGGVCMRTIGLNLLRGADFRIQGGAQGFTQVALATGGAKVIE